MSSSNTKILLARTIWDHHAAHSGYDNVFRQLKGDQYIHVVHTIRQSPSFLQRVFDTLFSLIWRDFREGYSSTYLLFELRLLWIMWFKNIKLIHLTDIGKNYKFLPNYLSKSNIKAVGTVHLPPSFYKAGWKQIERLAFLDTIIVLDQKSKLFFKQQCPSKTIQCIPHAVDTTYFRPPQQARSKDKLHCLTVGSFMRDLDSLQQIILTLEKEQVQDIHFHIVYPWRQLHHIEGFRFTKILQLDHVHAYDRLSDEELLALYQKCHVILLPLFDATANNSLLEGMACGMIPIVVSADVTDYVDRSFSVKESIINVCSFKKELEQKECLLDSSSYRRITEDNFSVPVILKRLKQIYQK